MKPLNVLPKFENHFANQTVRFQIQLEADAHLTIGEYRNVYLTEKEYNQLKADFSGLDSLIEQLSAYIQSTGKKYADHAATLRIWAKRQKTERKSTPGIPDYTFKEGESL